MLSIFLLIPLSLMLFVVAIWAVRYAVKSNQFEDLDNASQLIILEDRQERRQTIQSFESTNTSQTTSDSLANHDIDDKKSNDIATDSLSHLGTDDSSKL